MSGQLAIAEPRRIKASHRRRRKVAVGPFVQRYYDPQIGRFLSVDPVAANQNTGASFSRYNYANNNPYRFTDPDGRAPGDPFKTKDAAAIDAIQYVNAQSIAENAEYGGTLYQVIGGDGSYFATMPESSGQGTTAPTKLPTCTGCVASGRLHTHGSYSKKGPKGPDGKVTAIATGKKDKDDFNSDEFSAKDVAGSAEIREESKNPKWADYLGTPGGLILKLDASGSTQIGTASSADDVDKVRSSEQK